MVESYEQACAEHEWHVPERYNIAADVCDKHPRDKPAMVWEHFDGATRELDWGELQALSNQAAHVLRAHGVGRATGSRSSSRPRPRPRRSSSAPGSSARSCSRCRCSTATRGSATGSRTRPRRCWSPTRPTPAASTPRSSTSCSSSTTDLLAGHPDRPRLRGHRGRRPGAALLHVGHHRAWRRASSTPTATSSPTRSSSTATTSATASSSTAWASGPGRPASPRCSGRGGSARPSSSTSARAASTRPSSSTSSPATGSRTCSRPRPRCGR